MNSLILNNNDNNNNLNKELNDPFSSLTQISSEDLKELMKDFVKFRAIVPSIFKDKVAKIKSKKTGMEFSYKYAALPDVLDTITIPLLQNNLLLFQPMKEFKETTYLFTVLYHTPSGQWLKSVKQLKMNESTNLVAYEQENQGTNLYQKFGAALAITRKQMIVSLLGLAQEDDDGNLINENVNKNNGIKQNNLVPDEIIISQQERDYLTKQIKSLCKQKNINIELFVKNNNISSKDLNSLKFGVEILKNEQSSNLPITNNI